MIDEFDIIIKMAEERKLYILDFTIPREIYRIIPARFKNGETGIISETFGFVHKIKVSKGSRFELFSQIKQHIGISIEETIEFFGQEALKIHDI